MNLILILIGLAIGIGAALYYLKLKSKEKAPKPPTKKGNKTKAETAKDSVVNPNQKNKNKFWSWIGTTAGVVVIIVIIVCAASILIPLGMSIVSLFKSKPAVTYTQPAPPTVTKTFYTATKAGVKVYMQTQYWSACPVNTKEKIKAVSPTGETVVIELGVPTSTHFTAGWYTFYAVNKNKIKFWVEQ